MIFYINVRYVFINKFWDYLGIVPNIGEGEYFFMKTYQSVIPCLNFVSVMNSGVFQI